MKKIIKKSVVELPKKTGQVSDTINVTDKVTNAPSINLVQQMVGVPTDGIIYYEGDVVPEGYEEVESIGANVYSKEEQVIGTWINGKPLYRKTVYSTSITGSTDITKSTCDFIRTKNIDIHINEYIFPPARYISNTDRIDFFYNKNGGNFSLGLGSAWENGFNLIVFDLEYTKVTDDASIINLITFTIDSTTYQAEEGMTWKQWVNSEYPKKSGGDWAGCYIDSNNTIKSSGAPGSYLNVSLNDIIIANNTYQSVVSGPT